MKKFILMLSIVSPLHGAHYDNFGQQVLPQRQPKTIRTPHDPLFMTDYTCVLITNHYKRQRTILATTLATQAEPTRLCLTVHIKKIDHLYMNNAYAYLQKILHEPYIELFLSFYDHQQLLDTYNNNNTFQPYASAANEDAINHMYATLSDIAIDLRTNTHVTVRDIPYRLIRLKQEIQNQENYFMNKNEQFLYEQLKLLHNFYTEQYYAKLPI